MNEIISALILAIVQGITEWLPISSSGHLVIFEKLLDYQGGLTFEVALHFGTLMAVFVYFGKDIVDIIRDVIRFEFDTENGRTGLLLLIATIPAGIVGFIFMDLFEGVFNNLYITAIGFGITGLLLLISSHDIKPRKENLSYKDSLLIGIAQIFSILPGISRSGTTMASGMLLGLSPKAAARFSFLLSIPVIFGANILVIGNERLPPNLIWASLVSFLVGLAVMHWMFKFVLNSKKNLRWFGAYALLLAAGVFVYLFFF
ncbi:MAG: undecaprenyl-diphosphate phosphatase [Nanoarchaeota archaeon]|nr:undecaprenyl-diphosphate phosphatase [Nanoarchaeota archaeon]